MDVELAILCQSCGLCCDGSLFGRVGIEPDEVDAARRHRLSVVPSGKAFDQPCAALVTGDSGLRCCSMYEERPRACRRFVCKLYDRHVREGGPIEERLAVVRRVRALLASLRDETSDPRAVVATPKYRELMRSLEDDFSRACCDDPE